jgi:TetR/AcrR family transcriptional regulator, mexJK operon transcriptional repressor
LTLSLGTPEGAAMNEQSPISRRARVQSGRPTREHAQRRQEQLLERALEMFSEHGFEMTTIDGIAVSLNMTKRTIYARFPDKAALFEAAVKRAIERWFIPIEVLRSADTGDLEGSLIAISRVRVANNMSREGIRLQRVVTSEAFRFPEIYRTYETVSAEVIAYLKELFDKYRRETEGPWFEDYDLAATAFLSIMNAPVRQTVLHGRDQKPEAVEEFIRKAVRLFLDGMRPRS